MLIVNVLASPNLPTKSGAKIRKYLVITTNHNTIYTVNHQISYAGSFIFTFAAWN